MEIDKIKQDWHNRGFSFGVWEDPPEQVWENFKHDVDELLMLAEGSIEVLMQGKRIRPHIGQEILIPAGVTHTVRNIGEFNNRWYYGYRH
jgi:mannose-6-phosphate isomerase-like protein (cupin superfamily)